MKTKIENLKAKAAASLLELLVVIAVIALIAGVMIPTMQRANAAAFTVPTQATPPTGVKPRVFPLLSPTTLSAAATIWNKTTNVIGLTTTFQHPLCLWVDITATNYSNLGAALVTNIWDFAYDSAGTNFTTNQLSIVTTCNGSVEHIGSSNLLSYQYENATGIRHTKTLVDSAKTTGTGLKIGSYINITP